MSWKYQHMKIQPTFYLPIKFITPMNCTHNIFWYAGIIAWIYSIHYSIPADLTLRNCSESDCWPYSFYQIIESQLWSPNVFLAWWLVTIVTLTLDWVSGGKCPFVLAMWQWHLIDNLEWLWWAIPLPGDLPPLTMWPDLWLPECSWYTFANWYD